MFALSYFCLQIYLLLFLACLCKPVKYAGVAWNFYTSGIMFSFLFFLFSSVSTIQQSSPSLGEFTSIFSSDKAMNLTIWLIVPIIRTHLLTSLIIWIAIFRVSRGTKCICLFNVRLMDQGWLFQRKGQIKGPSFTLLRTCLTFWSKNLKLAMGLAWHLFVRSLKS